MKWCRHWWNHLWYGVTTQRTEPEDNGSCAVVEDPCRAMLSWVSAKWTGEPPPLHPPSPITLTPALMHNNVKWTHGCCPRSHHSLAKYVATEITKPEAKGKDMCAAIEDPCAVTD